MLSLGQIERRARQLLRDHRVGRAPVDVHALARKLGAVVREEASDSDISGALFREGDQAIIGVNASHPLIRKRFTVAHEIGHLVLHDEIARIDHHYPEVTGGTRLRLTALRSKLSTEAVDPREIEANRFAAALLMPTDFLERRLKSHELPLTEDEIAELANLFKVSKQAMNYRLINLGIPLDIGGERRS
jgi:Zn-dependent peptidase ImmA (M78 family)